MRLIRCKSVRAHAWPQHCWMSCANGCNIVKYIWNAYCLHFIYISHHFTAREDMNSINWPRSQCVALHSSVGRASHRYRGAHGFESRWSPKIFQASFQLLKLEIYCGDHSSLSDATLLCYASVITEQKKYWELLSRKFEQFQTSRNSSQQLAITCNREYKRTQHVTPDKGIVAWQCCVHLDGPLRWTKMITLGSGFMRAFWWIPFFFPLLLFFLSICCARRNIRWR